MFLVHELMITAVWEVDRGNDNKNDDNVDGEKRVMI